MAIVCWTVKTWNNLFSTVHFKLFYPLPFVDTLFFFFFLGFLLRINAVRLHRLLWELWIMRRPVGSQLRCIHARVNQSPTTFSRCVSLTQYDFSQTNVFHLLYNEHYIDFCNIMYIYWMFLRVSSGLFLFHQFHTVLLIYTVNARRSVAIRCTLSALRVKTF